MVDYDSQNPWFCPGAAEDNAPTGLILKGRSTIQWEVPSTMANIVFGYRVSVFLKNVDTEEWEPVAQWTARLLRTYGDNPDISTKKVSGKPIYSVDTGITPGKGEEYKVDVSTFNMDGVESVTVSVTETVR